MPLFAGFHALTCVRWLAGFLPSTGWERFHVIFVGWVSVATSWKPLEEFDRLGEFGYLVACLRLDSSSLSAFKTRQIWMPPGDRFLSNKKTREIWVSLK